MNDFNFVLSIRPLKHTSNLPIAESLVVVICTVILVVDGLLRTSTIDNAPALSSTLYDDSLKDTVTAVKLQMLHHKVMLTYLYVHFNKHAVFNDLVTESSSSFNCYH